MSQGLTNYLRNKIVDWFHRGVAFTPPTTYYVSLSSTTPSAAAGGTECTGVGYARQAITKSTTAWAATNADGSTANPSTGTNGTTSNNAIVDFGTAGTGWGTQSHWELWDAVTAGNRLMWGEIVDGSGNPLPRTISSGDPVSVPISQLKVSWG